MEGPRRVMYAMEGRKSAGRILAERSSRHPRHKAEAKSSDSESITVTVSKSEAMVIKEYFKLCGESVSEIIRKFVLRDATLEDYSPDDARYQFSIKLPSDITPNERRRQLEANYNRLRAMLGLEPIRI